MSRLANLEENYAVFVALSDAAKKQLATVLHDIGVEGLAAQSVAAPYETGRLRNALSVSEALQLLRVRIGYPDLKRSKDYPFYAVFEEFGVEAGSKMVTRLNRRHGRTVQKGKAKVYPRTTYLMRWKARPARDFVRISPRLDAMIDGMVGDFWEKVLAQMGDAS